MNKLIYSIYKIIQKYHLLQKFGLMKELNIKSMTYGMIISEVYGTNTQKTIFIMKVEHR